ncbi:hypothetical protein [Patulibacter minatonensis]|uniref:hypothetical protein n=1 Tax=Patulibacter minatonensis TaxID=298163 RepID=UPI00047C979B|nr:hypothetical protein [Patulibacter minatonensis]
MRVHRALSLAVLVPVVALGASTAGAADGDAKDPRQLLKDAAASLAKVKSYHVSASSTDADGTLRYTADVQASGNANVTLKGANGTFRLRKVSSTTYLSGDARYWRNVGGKQGAALAKKLAGRWIKVAKADAKEFAGIFTEIAPERIASCLVAPGTTGTLTAGKASSVGGTKADVLVDAGDEPGTAPGRLFLAASGDPLPLRLLQTGKVKPGGKATSCTDPDDTSTASDLRFSKFDEKLTIRAPKKVLKAPSTGSGGGSTGTPV